MLHFRYSATSASCEMSAEAESSEANDDFPDPLVFTEAAALKVKGLIEEEGNPELKLRVFISGGGCSGFQYGFTFDEDVNDGDTAVEKEGVKLLIDPMSYQYLLGACLLYTSPSPRDGLLSRMPSSA